MALTSKTIFSFCSIQFCLTMLYGNLPVSRIMVYINKLKMPLGTMSWMVTLAKTIDILTGFLIGKASDDTRSRFGRRKPYLMILWPLGTVVLLLLVAAGQIFGADAEEAMPCSDLPKQTNATSQCAMLQACLDGAIAEGTVPAPLSATMSLNGTSSSEATGGVASFFLILYILYFATIVSGTQIPYDALAQEIPSNYDERERLFMWKPLFNLFGGLIGTVVFTLGISANPSDNAFGALVVFIVQAIFNFIALGLLLWGVQERPLPKSKELPLGTSVLRLLSNPRYRIYLLMRVPMTVLGLLPYQMILFFIQNNLAVESAASWYTVMAGIALLGAISSTPAMTWASKRFGRPATLTFVLGSISVVFLVCFFIPFDSARGILYLVAPFLGVCLAVPYVIPDAMLGDIIDHDELLTGERNEAMYTMVETNVQQLVEILLGVATMSMAAAGFENLGGCKCGCGVACADIGYPYARWVCPGSIGYSCDGATGTSGAVGSPLLYEAEPPMAPCNEQTSSVRWVTALFTFGLPGVCGLLAIYPVRRAVITRAQHESIIEGIAQLKADPKAEVLDPLTGKPIVRPSSDEASVYAEQFTAWERTMAAADGVAKLVKYLGARLGAYGAILIILIAVNAAAANETVLQMSLWVLAALLVLGPFDASRFRAAQGWVPSAPVYVGCTSTADSEMTPSRA